jgi:endonuclease/exonuclease/phosphatase family metal-dependent hydrolase
MHCSTSITLSNEKISQSKGNAMNATARASRIGLVLFTTLAMFFGQSAIAGGVSKVRVMTQNQYLGADLTPIVAAGNFDEFNDAVITALGEVAANNYPERVQSLAATIAGRSPHLVGLQEMFAFGCTSVSLTIPDPCGLFGPAFNDHSTATVAALQGMGADYSDVATVKNLSLDFIFPGPTAAYGEPGIPVFLDLDPLPDIFVTVIDRDVILARGDVSATPVTFACARPSVDGCNFVNVAPIEIAGVPINIERGFVAVDAMIKGDAFRFVNTHLEVRQPDPTDPLSMGLQALQASELLGALTLNPERTDSRVVLVGDFNSDPGDVPPVPFFTPYQQMVTGRAIDGTQISMPISDTWLLRPQDEPGLTCCEDGDLLNATSEHVRRVDIIFSKSVPDNVNASKVLNTSPDDKTPSGLWPSDHASVDAMLQFRGN